MYIIFLMEMLDMIVPYLSLGLFGLLGIFVVFGMLFGMGRGVKRAGLRLVIFGGLLLVAFFLTPVIANALLGINLQIGGASPREHMEAIADTLVEALRSAVGDNILPFVPYFQDYALGIVVAVLNLAVFFLLYFIIKVLSWIVYAIVAPFAAPKRDHEGNKKPKHVWWGALVGAVQGVVLFVFFFIPLNGILAVVDQAAHYQPVAVASVAAEVEEDEDQVNVMEILDKVDGALSSYNSVMKYTGLQFISKQALSYQLTIRPNGKSNVNLVHDINTFWELFRDSEALGEVMVKVTDASSNGFDLSDLTADDYTVVRNFINKAFKLQLLNVVDQLIGDLDTIMNTPFGDDDSYLVPGIHADSIYGNLVLDSAKVETEVDEATGKETVVTNYYAEYAAGVRALVKYVADQKLDLVRKDLINIVDFVEAVNSYEITYKALSTTDGVDSKKLLTVLSNAGSLSVQEYFDLATARLAKDSGNAKAGTPIINVLGNHLGQFALVKMLGAPDLENLVIYGKLLDGKLDGMDGLEDLVYGLADLFLGEKAFAHTDADGNPEQGSWSRLADVLLDVAEVLRDYITIMDDIAKYKDDILLENPDMDDTTAQTQAILEYLASLVIDENYYNEHKAEFPDADHYSDAVKYQKVDQLADAIYNLVNAFPPVKDFLVLQLRNMGGENEYIDTLITMFNKDIQEWYSTLESIVNLADKLQNSILGDLMSSFQGGEFDGEAFFDTLTDMTAEDVGELLNDILELPEIGDLVQDTLTDALNQIDEDVLKDVFGEENYEDVQENLDELKKVLEKYDDPDADKTELEAELKEKVGNLWDVVSELLGKNGGADEVSAD